MNLIETYPWFAPSLLLISLGALVLSYVAFKSERYLSMTALGMLQTFISMSFATSIGPILFGIGLTQFYVGIVNMKRVKAMRHE